MPGRSLDVRHFGGADDRRHRRAQCHRHEQGSAARTHLSQQDDQDISDYDRFFRHGGYDPARRQLLPACGARARGAEAGPVSAGSRRRRQVLARRAAEAPDGIAAVLCARRRRRGEPHFRIASRPVPTRRDGRIHGAAIPNSRPSPDRDLLALGGEAARSVRRRSVEVFRRQDVPLEASPDRRRQDRTRRRKQSGHLGAGRQDRHPQARTLLPARPRRVQLFGRPQPHDAGAARIRGNVQGADQGSASPPDSDAGRQLRGHRKPRRPALPGGDPGPFQRIRSGSSSRTTRTTRPSSTVSAWSRFPTACA